MRPSWLLGVLLGGLALACLLLIVFHDTGMVLGIESARFASLTALIAFGAVVGLGTWHRFARRIGTAVVAALFWLVVVAVLALFYTYRAPLRDAAERVMAELVPGYAARTGGAQTVEVARTANGDFRINAVINGVGLPMLLDTGASTIVLSQEAAAAIGLPLATLRYDVPIDTANGRTRAAAVTLERVEVGAIAERGVRALVAAPGALRGSLLGMSFLSRLEGFEVRGDRLILRGPAR
ncbi:TIGR02281 family clan AA aspartic protease [Aquabacter spiritensis]|uniref:Aspartyl protease family protein n=1 Tax=Aquabacter spiritensis TaxID=933073 RepID=A0A4R3M0I6_9HYPH|nr:TIGR02281 family clan AA aspartic protease [Aquabacter spiritensis]TCT04597.1 aspartyl protease family protein [Aquabacter spiritensis]